MKKILILSSLGLILGACTTDSNADISTDETTAPVVETVVEDTSVEKEPSDLIVEPLTTTFEPVVLEVPQLTEEEEVLHQELSDRINSEEDVNMTDREYMESIAHEYDGYTPEELGEFWYKGADAKTYGRYGDTAIYITEQHEIANEAIQVNILSDDYELLGGQWDWNDNLSILEYNSTIQVTEEDYAVSIYLEFSDDYRTAELVRFVLDGEEIIEGAEDIDI